MDFKMNAVIHRGNDYENSLRTFQNKRMEYLEQEIRAFDVETLRLLLYDLQKRGRTIETLTGVQLFGEHSRRKSNDTKTLRCIFGNPFY